MAIATAADIITEVRAHLRGVDSTTVGSYLSIVMDELCKDLPIVVDKVSLALTANTSEYSLAAGSPFYTWGTTTTSTSVSLVRIESAHYLTSADSRRLLEPTVVQKLDQTPATQDWRYQDSGTPEKIAVTPTNTGSFAITLYPAPDTTSSPANGSGYPRVDIVFREKIGAAFTGSAAIPASITDPDVLIQGTLAYVHQRENGEPGIYWELYMKAKAKLADEIARRHREFRPNFVNTIKAPRGV